MKLNLGCGYNHAPGYINIDIRPECRPSLICDLSVGVPFPDNSIEEIKALDILEHIPIGKTINLMNEIWRVLKPGGWLKVLVPSTDGRGAFQDPTHVSFWNENSFLYFMDNMSRGLYGIKAKFRGKLSTVIIDADLKNPYVQGTLRADKS